MWHDADQHQTVLRRLKSHRAPDLIFPIVAAIQALMHQLTSLEATVAGFADNFVSAHITVTTLEADSIIAKKMQTQSLCAQKSDGTSICVNGDQLAALLAAAGGANQSPATAQPGPVGTSTLPGSVTQNDAASTTPPTIVINGDNPAIIHVGDSYADLGATITGPQSDLNLGIKTFLNGTLVSNIVLDTSSVATDTIDYVATDEAGLTSISTRTVLIEAADAPSIVPTDDASTAAATSTSR